MADNTTPAPPPAHSSSLGEPVDFDVRRLGRRLPRTEAPEGWIKRIERRRQGRVWVGYSHVWTTNADGRRVRRKKEKTLGPASMPKHEAQSKLADYIEEYTSRVTKQGSAIEIFANLWRAFSAVRSGRWSKKTKEDRVVTTDLCEVSMQLPMEQIAVTVGSLERSRAILSGSLSGRRK